jgi:hypothetical protein
MAKCSNKECQYNLEAYSEHAQWRGLCLNCIDDDRQDKERAEIELYLDSAPDQRLK